MFAKDITGSDAFREMPPSTQALYFHLGMEADDDGFLDNYKGLMRSVNASEDDLKILLAKRFLILFPSKVVVVKHWLINNTIRKDRYNETKHLDEKRALLVKENGSYTELLKDGVPSGNHLATKRQPSIEEKSIEEKSIVPEQGSGAASFINLFQEINPSYSQLFKRPPQRAAADRLLKLHDFGWWQRFFLAYNLAIQDRFCPKAMTPIQLEESLGRIIAFGQARKQGNKYQVDVV